MSSENRRQLQFWTLPVFLEGNKWLIFSQVLADHFDPSEVMIIKYFLSKQVKKFRKGKIDNLDFLEDDKKGGKKKHTDK